MFHTTKRLIETLHTKSRETWHGFIHVSSLLEWANLYPDPWDAYHKHKLAAAIANKHFVDTPLRLIIDVDGNAEEFDAALTLGEADVFTLAAFAHHQRMWIPVTVGPLRCNPLQCPNFRSVSNFTGYEYQDLRDNLSQNVPILLKRCFGIATLTGQDEIVTWENWARENGQGCH